MSVTTVEPAVSIDDIREEIARRGGETFILSDRKGAQRRYVQLRDSARDPWSDATLYLAGVDAWRDYADGFRWTSLRYLYGVDDNGPWAVRVPGNCDSVLAALDKITPADVRKARAAGKKVKRQGDVYAVQTTKAYDSRGAEDLVEPDGRHGHFWNPETRYLTHRAGDGRNHRPLRVSYPVRFVRQSTIAMGRGNGRGPGD
jgi:hypothetical protein